MQAEVCSAVLYVKACEVNVESKRLRNKNIQSLVEVKVEWKEQENDKSTE